MTLENAVIEIGTLTFLIVGGLGGIFGVGTFGYLLRQFIVGFSDLPNIQRLERHNNAAIRRKPRQWREVKDQRATLKRCLVILGVVVVLGVGFGVALILDPPVERQGVKVLNVTQGVAAIGVFVLAILGWIVEAWRHTAKKALDGARAAFPN